MMMVMMMMMMISFLFFWSFLKHFDTIHLASEIRKSIQPVIDPYPTQQPAAGFTEDLYKI